MQKYSFLLTFWKINDRNNLNSDINVINLSHDMNSMEFMPKNVYDFEVISI